MTDKHRQHLDYLIEERVCDIYFLLKDELEVDSGSAQEKLLYDACEDFKNKIEVLKSEVGYMVDFNKISHKKHKDSDKK